MEITGSYSTILVVVSIIAAISSSFVALTTVPRISSSTGWKRSLPWAITFGASMGTGIWTMHFIAMLAFHLPVDVHYDAMLTTLSLLLAIVVSALAILPIRSGGEIGIARGALIGALMGSGIAGMHYTGMAAMRMNASMQYDIGIVVLSIIIAMVASTAALMIANYLREAHAFGQLRVKSFAAAIMGLAVASMHYTAMLGVKFHALPISSDLSGHVDPHFLAVAVIVMAFLIQGGVLVAALLDEAYITAKTAEQIMKRRADMHSALSEILSTALKGQSLKTVLDRVLEIILEIDWLALKKQGAIFIADYKDESINMLVNRNLQQELMASCAKVKFGQCLCGKAAATGEVVFKACVDDEHSIRPMSMQEHGHYCIPFPSQGPALGVINLYVQHDHVQTDYEIQFLNAVADAVAAIVRQSQLESQADKIFKAIDQAGEAVLITDRDGVIEYVNQAFMTNTGFQADEALGRLPSIMKSGEQGEPFYRKMWETILGGDVWQGEVIERRKDGSTYPAMLTISPIRDSEGDISHFVGIHEDLSEHKSLEQQFRQAQKMEALGTLVGGIAHDFNNMLAGMIGNLFLVKQRVRDMPDVEEQIEQVEKVGFQAADMIQQMMIFARNDDVRLEEMSLSSFIREAFKLNQLGLPENIMVNMNISSEPLMINGNPTQLQQVLLNMFGNARDALEGIESPEVEFVLDSVEPDRGFRAAHPAAAAGGYAHIRIADNGAGISNDDIEHIFDPFFTTKEVGKGTGLGLAMSAGIIKSHNGFIDVAGRPGEGAVFDIYLPLVTTSREAKPEDAGQVELRERGETILIVDDDSSVRSSISEALQSLGYRVRFASNGQEALDIYRRGGIDLVILDVVMPSLGGADCAREMLAIDPEARIIFATGYDREKGLESADDLKAIPVISKPFRISEIDRLIRQQLG